jgi:proliferating cell nuclear antigen PCNA
MNVKINNPAKCEVFHIIFQNMKLYSDNVNVLFKTDCLFIQTMDASHISIFELNIPSSWFDEYSVQQDITLGINTVLMFKILSTREKTQNIHIHMENRDTDILDMCFSSEKVIFNKSFQIPLMDIDGEQLSIPEMEYEADFSLPAADFSQLVNQLKLFGDNIDISCSEEEIALHTKTSESGMMTVKIKIDDLTSFEIEENKELNISFSLNHLCNIMQFNKIASDVNLSLTAGYPLKTKLVISETENAYIVMYLAPRITDDE